MISHRALGHLLHRDCEFRIGSSTGLRFAPVPRGKCLYNQTELLHCRDLLSCANSGSLAHSHLALMVPITPWA